jgi:hypothetical protein
MLEIKIDLEALCTCGAELTVSQKWSGQIMIDPCDTCTDASYSQGHEEGYNKGLKESE